jgi:hypothetical protein
VSILGTLGKILPTIIDAAQSFLDRKPIAELRKTKSARDLRKETESNQAETDRKIKDKYRD